jgi:oligopeptide/dipeptide ABC transporter ATP-binding protein
VALLSVRDLSVTFAGGVAAVRDLSFTVDAGEVVGVVGESGSRKTATALAVLGLLPRSAAVDGSVWWKGSPMSAAAVRGREIGMVFQEPVSSLNPVRSVGTQVAEVLRVHEGLGRRAAAARAAELLAMVGLRSPSSYPHELSGGMCQRAMIAMAIACGPDLLIADEPTTALDVTVQAQVLDVLARVRAELGMAMLLITHDLGVVAGVADRVVVMYAGSQVEMGLVDEVFASPHHPYTAGLLASLPSLVGGGPLVSIGGAPPSPTALPPGCPFHPRCPIARAPGVCTEVVPPLRAVGSSSSSLSACHFAEELAP